MSANPVFVAVDTPDLARAQALARAVGAYVGGLKLGLEFFMANGPAGVRAVAELGLPVFLDVKLHDIPNTVAKAVEVAVAAECCARMALMSLQLEPGLKAIEPELLNKHFKRKHGPGAYYGQK